MASLSTMPPEVLAMIFARIHYDGRQGQSLRGICKKLEQCMNDKALPSMIAAEQYRSFYLIEKLFRSTPILTWSGLDAIYNKSQAYRHWFLLLPMVDRDILTTAIALIDASYNSRRVTQSVPLDVMDRSFQASLNSARLVRKVLPVEALILLRYVVSLTDQALQTANSQNPAGDFALSTSDRGQIAVNCLCRSLIFEAKVLTTIEQPYHLLFIRSRVAATYDTSLLMADLMREHLEDVEFDIIGCRGAVVLQLAADQVLEKYFSRNHEVLNSTSLSSSDGLGLGGAELFANRRKVSEAHQAHLCINPKVHAVFGDKDATKNILQKIDEEAIGKAMFEQFRIIGTMQGEGLRSAVHEELKALHLIHWSNSIELNSADDAAAETTE